MLSFKIAAINSSFSSAWFNGNIDDVQILHNYFFLWIFFIILCRIIILPMHRIMVNVRTSTTFSLWVCERKPLLHKNKSFQYKFIIIQMKPFEYELLNVFVKHWCYIMHCAHRAK